MCVKPWVRTAAVRALIGLTRPKISDRWRERGSHRKSERGAASGSLHRMVRPLLHILDPKNVEDVQHIHPSFVYRVWTANWDTPAVRHHRESADGCEYEDAGLLETQPHR